MSTALVLVPSTSDPVSEYDRCCWCGHDWHGIRCAKIGTAGQCSCESSLHRPDDAWRPELSTSDEDLARKIMHETGCDGYTAMSCVGPTVPGRNSPWFRRLRLYGPR